MTAEVAVINPNGIALAADSAVTMTAGGENKRAFTHSNKIFELSKKQPIGVMIYGNAFFGTLPLEALIKNFRQISHKREYKTVNDCVNDFIKFLSRKEFLKCCPSKDYTKFLLANLVNNIAHDFHKQSSPDLQHLVNETNKKIVSEFKNIGKITPRPNFNKFIRNIDILETKEFLLMVYKEFLKNKNFDKHSVKQFKATITEQPTINNFIRTCFFIQSKKIEGLSSTGIFICGYGDLEYLPCYWQGILDGTFMDKLRIWKVHDLSSAEESSARLIPFAQKDVIETFMSGLDTSFFKFLTDTQKLFQEKVLEEVYNIAGYNEKGEKITHQEEFLNKLIESWHKRLVKEMDNSSQVIMENIQHLPKEEMANLAEALIELTSVKRQVDENIPTVGGPTDVAVISKGDGFVWIKRKHYFDEKLNNSWYKRNSG